MMIHSMTGFGSASSKKGKDGIEAEVRSVNNRFLKTDIRLPKALAPCEDNLQTILKKNISRGTVTLTVKYQLPPESLGLSLNTDAIKKYVRQLKDVQRQAGLEGAVSLETILGLPYVIQSDNADAKVSQKLRREVLSVALKAVSAMIRMRAKEGRALAQDLTKRKRLISNLLSKIARRTPKVVVEHQRRIIDRVRELLRKSGETLDHSAVAREMAIFADRCDISEEVSRTKSHLQQFDAALKDNEPAGRKLDFIIQEMMREANTIGSKGSDTEISKHIVEIKAELEKLREQVQNIE